MFRVRSLLDVSVIIALIDPDHSMQDVAHDWWASNCDDGWASCPIVENGVVRIMSMQTYSREVQFTPNEVIRKLRAFINGTNHEFWQDGLSIVDDNLFDSEGVLFAKSITDLYLLALATKHEGRLATFDQRISLAAVRNAKPENLVVV
jgi:uncharacterized protein